jgi:hypothetical protein
LIYTEKKKKQSSDLLNIQRAFHDGYTTLSFMKGFLCFNSIDHYSKEYAQYYYILYQYYSVVQGGIASRLRKAISKYIPDFEDKTYGPSEPHLYSMLIRGARATYEIHEKEFQDLFFSKEFQDNEFISTFISITKCYIGELFRDDDSKKYTEFCKDIVMC